MKEKTQKLVTIICLAVAALVSVCAIMFAINKEKYGGLFDIAFWTLVAFIVISLVLWLLFGGISVAKKPVKPLIILGIAAVVIIGSFLIAGGDVMDADFMSRYNVSERTAKLVATATYITYAVVIAAVVFMIYSMISKSLKK